MNSIKRTRHAVYDLKYHQVQTPKYRKQILKDDVAEFIEAMIRHAVLERLSQRIDLAVQTEQILPAIVETVAHALKLPYGAITLRHGDAFNIVAEYFRSSAEKRVYEATEIPPWSISPKQLDNSFSLLALQEKFFHSPTDSFQIPLPGKRALPPTMCV